MTRIGLDLGTEIHYHRSLQYPLTSILLGTMSIANFVVCFLAVVMTVAGEPTGYRPAMAPNYQAPAYKAPTYKAPAYQPPAYQPPAYQPPAYQPPAYKAPAYQPPAYKAPAYMAPTPSYKAASSY
ncbi:repetitive proline-rich cell wall protein 1 [Daphnia magna]|uniref:repetitive proline-rich cell wall protein 1 n=1 Tax=Daphnia magna TaxID=35525 RepID=UPI001E1BB3BE|nr:repetitive proline-rich cell wall protein 1 [Daphnia magna]